LNNTLADNRDPWGVELHILQDCNLRQVAYFRKHRPICKKEGKAVPLHAMEVLGGRGV
jgi:hypothetical protein